MQIDQQGFAQSYRDLPDNEIALLYTQTDMLTEPARMALAAEIEQRGLNADQLQKLHSTELRREANFDRREKWRRKSTASFLLFRNDPKGTLLMLIGFLVLVLILEIVRKHHH